MGKNIKEIFLSFIFILVGFFSWYFLYPLFYRDLTNLKTGLFALILFIVFGAVYSVFSFVVKSKKFIFLSFFIVSILPIFIFEFDLYLACGSVIFFVLLSFGFWILKRERDLYSLKLRPMWILRNSLGYFFLALSLMTALIFYLSPLGEFKLGIPSNLFDAIFKELQPLISSQLPGFNPEMTFDDFLVNQYLFIYKVQSKSLKTSGNINFLDFFRDPAFAEISKIAQNSDQKYLKTLVSQNKKVLEANKKNLSETFGIEIKGNEKLKDILYQWINNKLLIISKPYQEYISLGFVLVVFLTLQTLNLPYKWITSFLGWILFKILLLIRVAKIQKESVEREAIIL